MNEEKRRADQMEIGDEFQSYEFTVSTELNQQYLFAVEDYHPAYLTIGEHGGPFVHPGLLLNMSNIPKSPSFFLPPGMAGIIAREATEFLNPGRVGKRFRVTWRVSDKFEKRGRDYWWITADVVDEDGLEIIKRRMLDTYMGEGS